MGTNLPLTRRRAEARHRLLEVAEELFEQHGYERVSPADIAAVAEIGRTTFYEYFVDKEDLLASLVEERLPDVGRRLLSGIPENLPAEDQLAELAIGMVEFAITDHTLGLMIHQGLPTLSTATQHRIAEAHREISHEFARLYKEAMLAGQLRPIPPDLAGVFVQDVIMAAAKVLIRHPEPKERLHEVADEAVRFLFHGLSPVK